MDQARPGSAGAAAAGAALLVVLAPVLLLALWVGLGRLTAPSDGTVVQVADSAWQRGALTVGKVADPGSGLRPGDRVLAVDGVAVSTLATDRPLRVRDGQRLVYRVERGSGPGRQVLDVPVLLTRYPVAGMLERHLGVLPLALTEWLVAAFVLLRRPRHGAARAFYAMLLLLVLGATAFPFGASVLDAVSGRLWPFLAGDVANTLLWGATLHFVLLLPDQPGFRVRRRWVVAGYLLPFALYLGRLAVFLPGAGTPMARLGVPLEVSIGAAHVQPVLILGAVLAGFRATGADPLARRRMGWVLAASGIGTLAYLLLGQLPSRVAGDPLVPWDWLTVLFVPFPVALGVAVLRYRLFDIQVVLRRSLVYGAVTLALAAVYLALVTGLTRLLPAPDPVAAGLAALAVAVLFAPLRDRAHRLVGRHLFGDRDDPYRVITRLGDGLDAPAGPDAVLETVVETLVDALRLDRAAITLDGRGTVALGVSAGSPAGTPGGQVTRIPVLHGGVPVGVLELDPGPRREPFGPGDRALLDGLARQVGVIAQNLVLQDRLQASLQKAVSTREEERRRLRRDLHDGLGPTLAASSQRLELAAGLVDRDPARAREVLEELAGTHRAAVAELRRLVRGLHPPALDQLGLVGALKEQAARFPGTVVQADDAGLDDLPAALEVAAWFIAAEGMTNAARHSAGTRCTVRLHRAGGALLVEVADDGRGLPAEPPAGVGLASIRERAAELGGTVEILSGAADGAGTGPGPDGGTTVRARLPLP